MSDDDPEPYRLVVTRPAARVLADRLPEKVATPVLEFMVSALVENPRRLGKPLLLPPYEGTWSARRGAFRVFYTIDDGSRTVTVTAIDHRADVYRSR